MNDRLSSQKKTIYSTTSKLSIKPNLLTPTSSSTPNTAAAPNPQLSKSKISPSTIMRLGNYFDLDKNDKLLDNLMQMMNKTETKQQNSKISNAESSKDSVRPHETTVGAGPIPPAKPAVTRLGNISEKTKSTQEKAESLLSKVIGKNTTLSAANSTTSTAAPPATAAGAIQQEQIQPKDRTDYFFSHSFAEKQSLKKASVIDIQNTLTPVMQKNDPIPITQKLSSVLRTSSNFLSSEVPLAKGDPKEEKQNNGKLMTTIKDNSSAASASGTLKSLSNLREELKLTSNDLKSQISLFKEESKFSNSPNQRNNKEDEKKSNISRDEKKPQQVASIPATISKEREREDRKSVGNLNLDLDFNLLKEDIATSGNAVAPNTKSDKNTPREEKKTPRDRGEEKKTPREREEKKTPREREEKKTPREEKKQRNKEIKEMPSFSLDDLKSSLMSSTTSPNDPKSPQRKRIIEKGLKQLKPDELNTLVDVIYQRSCQLNAENQYNIFDWFMKNKTEN